MSERRFRNEWGRGENLGPVVTFHLTSRLPICLHKLLYIILVSLLFGVMNEEDWEPFFDTGNDEETEAQRNLRLRREAQREAIALLRPNPAHYEASWRFFRDTLGSPRYWCAPMVGASELAFRMMVRKYGASIATTPMISAGGYVQNPSYREQFKFLSSQEDRPLIVQFSANDGAVLLEAVRLVEDHCDAVEINLGCPQQCARNGNYGAFLMRSPEILYEMVSTVAQGSKIPVLCKVRIFKNYQQTLTMCQMLQNAGCSVLTVHGRTKEQKRSAEHLADWNVIAKLKQDLQIPVISNGNIKAFEDLQDCLTQTKCDGVMSACALLANPALFALDREECRLLTPIQLALEYVEFARKYDANGSQVRKHLFSILRKPLNVNVEIGQQLLQMEQSKSPVDYDHVVQLLYRLEELETNRINSEC